MAHPISQSLRALVVTAFVLGAASFAEGQAISVSHSSATVRGNFSHSALIQPPIQVTERPGSTGVIITRPDHHHGRDRIIYIRGVAHCWVDGRYEWREEQVWVEGYWTERWVPATYTYRQRNGAMEMVLLHEGYSERVYVPGRHEVRRARVWVPGQWVARY